MSNSNWDDDLDAFKRGLLLNPALGYPLVRFPSSVFRRIEYLKIYMRNSVAELPTEDQDKIRSRLQGYTEAVDDALEVLRRLKIKDDPS